MNLLENEAAVDARWPIPVVPEPLIPVDRAWQRLSDAVGRVAVVAAPAGYGKTSQVAAWALADNRPVAWATLGLCGTDADSFLTVVWGMLHQVAGADPREFAGSPLDAQPSEQMTAATLGALVHECPTPFVLVFDDAHRVDDASVTELFQAVIDNIASESTVVLIARTAPHVALARLRAYERLVDVSIEDLALDRSGAQRLLESVGVTVDDETAERLVDQSEGWPVGIRRAASTLDRSMDSGPRPVGSDTVIVDFVREEWLGGVPRDAIDFLVRTSGVDRLTAPLCDHVLERSDSADMLHFWEGTKLLLPLDDRNGCFRLHRLLRDVLFDQFERSDSGDRQRVDLRASEWFERAGDVDDAIRFAVRGGQAGRAVRLVDEFAPRYLTTADYRSIERWMDPLPTETTFSSTTLCVTAAAVALSSGNSRAAKQWLTFAEAAAASGAHTTETETLHLESLQALLSPRLDARSVDRARHAYEGLPPGEWHAVACFAYGALRSMVGDDETALAVLAEGAVEAQLLDTPTTEAQCLAAQAAIVAASADWEQAHHLALSARARQRERQLDDLPQLVMVTSMSALVEAMAGDLDASRADIARSRHSLAHLAPIAGWVNIRARIILAEAALQLGDRVAAQTLLDEVEPILRDNPAATRSAEQFEHLAAQLRAGRAALPYGPSSLTAAELRLLSLLPTNLTLADIARRLFVSRNTAKSHAAAIYRKLGVSTRGEAVELARTVGLLPGDAGSPVVDRWSSPAAHRDELFEHPQIVEVAVD